MGEATDRTVTEIEEIRGRLEDDIRELEARIPAPLRSAKAVAGLILGSTALTALVVRKLKSNRANSHPTAEVVVRIVREDVSS